MKQLKKKTIQHTNLRSHTSARRMSGQALIVTLAFCAIFGAGLLALYNTIQLTNHKRDLITAADATAYSGASIIAQGLNYTAYTNRAILANNALIGQMTAARSTLTMSQWYWKNTSTIMRMIAGLTRFIPYVGAVVSSISNAASKFADIWGTKAIYPMQVLAEVLQTSGTAAVGLSNQAMWLSQQVHLADSLIAFEPNMIAIAKDNAPDAQIDAVLHATAFGPIVTLGMFAAQFKPKIRKSRRTIGTHEAEKDEYLNYLTEVNRHEMTPEYLAGRNLIPNAVGLWIATGCDNPLISATSGAFAQSAGLGSGVDTALKAVDTFASLLSVVANPVMCLFERHGGSELIQLEDGKMAWTSIDAMAFKIPIFGTRIPMAGGANMSFVENGKTRQAYPDAVRTFERLVKGNRLYKNAGEYMGHLSPKVTDCVEYLAPGTWKHYAVSTDTRISGTCAVLASGSADHLEKKGMWAGELEDATRKTLRSRGWSRPSATALLASLAAPLGAAADDLQAQLATSATPNLSPVSGLSNPLPAGVSGAGTSATTGLPNVDGLRSAGDALRSSGWMTGSLRTSITGIMQRLNPANFHVDPAGIVSSAAAGGGPGPSGQDGGPDAFTRILLKVTLGAFIDVDALIDLLSMQISNGVEKPRNATINRAFNLFADGLPPYFWDVRISDTVQTRGPGKEEDLVYTDAQPNDYHDRRYGLGPLVYVPLIQKNSTIKTASNLGIGGKTMGLPDYEATRSGLRAIGKARIFFRQPADHWLPRYKRTITANLILPYWSVRNESLSYVDKLGLLAIDGIANAVTP